MHCTRLDYFHVLETYPITSTSTGAGYADLAARRRCSSSHVWVPSETPYIRCKNEGVCEKRICSWNRAEQGLHILDTVHRVSQLHV
jgi:hypothetical protein